VKNKIFTSTKLIIVNEMVSEKSYEGLRISS